MHCYGWQMIGYGLTDPLNWKARPDLLTTIEHASTSEDQDLGKNGGMVCNVQE